MCLCEDIQNAECIVYNVYSSLRKKAMIHQVTTMLDTSKNVLFPG